jgi:hypothetical protein
LRSWARELGVDHVWLLRLIKRFMKDPGEPNRLLAGGLPQSSQLRQAQEISLQMRERGELRPLRYSLKNRATRGAWTPHAASVVL